MTSFGSRIRGLANAAIKASEPTRNDLQPETVAGPPDLAGIEGKPLRQGQGLLARDAAPSGQGAQRSVRGRLVYGRPTLETTISPAVTAVGTLKQFI